MDDSYTMDGTGFLQLANRLERRFDELTSPEALRVAVERHRRQVRDGGAADGCVEGCAISSADGLDHECDHSLRKAELLRQMRESEHAMLYGTGGSADVVPSSISSDIIDTEDRDIEDRTGDERSLTDDPPPYDELLFQLVTDLFGGTSWPAMFCVSASSFDAGLIDDCKRFLIGCANTVRRYGMAVWLYDLINDSTKAVFVSEPSDRMPLLIRMLGPEKLRRRAHTKGPSRYGIRGQLTEDMWEHCEQMHRLAAYSMLRWGGDESRAGMVAFMLLTRPELGMRLLREDGAVMSMGAAPDMRHRHTMAYVDELRDQADRQYAWSKGLASRGLGLEDADIDALTGREDGGTPELTDMDWRYAYDARHLIAAYRSLWNEGTPTADEWLSMIESERGIPDEPLWRNVVYLSMIASTLMGAGLAADLVCGFNARDQDRFDRGVARLETMIEVARSEGVILLPVAQIHDRSLEMDELMKLAPGKRERVLREMARAQSDMAAVMLARIPDRTVARRCAAALIQGDMGRYARLVADWMDLDVEVDDEEVDA